MNEQPRSDSETVDFAPSEQVKQLCTAFKAAWQEALQGGPAPAPDTYLVQVTGADRVLLCSSLEKIQKEYEVRLPLGDAAAAGESDWRLDTAKAGPDATIDQKTTPPSNSTHPPRQEESKSTVGEATIDQVGASEGGDTEFVVENKPGKAPRPEVAGYEILGVLGHGGMGVVYKARQVRLNRVVALKMVLAGAHASPQQLARFLTEAEAVAQLQHPNIVQIYEIGEHDGLPYFSLEFVDGGILTKKIAGKPQPAREAAETIELLALAMFAAHERGVIHRDLKPANILLTADGLPKITDFGLAKRLESDSSQTKSGTLMGTPSYMAPEQARGDIKEIGPLADVYALGVILYEMLTGRTPFIGTSILDTIQQVQTQEPVPPSRLVPKVPADLETICLKCLQKEPHKRYPSAEALARDLHHFLAGEPIEARPVGSAERLWRWCKRNPRVAALTSAVLALLVTVAVTSTVLLIQIAQEKAETELQRQAAVKAQGVAEDNEKIAKEAEKRAQANAVIAGEQGRLAVNTLYGVVTKVQQQLRSTAANQKLRTELLGDAFKGLATVISKGDESSELLGRTRAIANQHMGDISRELGRTEAALKHYHEAERIVERMANNDPTDPVHQWNRAAIYDKLGDAYFRFLGSGAVAREYYRKCLDLREEMAANPPDIPGLKPVVYADRLALAHSKQASMALVQGDPDSSWRSFQRSLELNVGSKFSSPGEALSSAKSNKFTTDLCMRMGDLGFHLRDAKAARGWYDRGLKLCEAAVKRNPKSDQAKQDLAAALAALGDLELQLGDAAKASALYAQAHPLVIEVASTDPDNVAMKRLLSMSLYRLGTAASLLGEETTADRHYQESLKLRAAVVKDDPVNTSSQIAVMLAEARCGQHAEAAERAAKLRKLAPNDPRILFFAASGYAVCAGAIGVGPSKDAALHAKYIALALETLSQAMAHGYRDVIALEHDPDLAAVRQDAGFRKMVEKLNGNSTGP